MSNRDEKLKVWDKIFTNERFQRRGEVIEMAKNIERINFIMRKINDMTEIKDEIITSISRLQNKDDFKEVVEILEDTFSFDKLGIPEAL